MSESLYLDPTNELDQEILDGVADQDVAERHRHEIKRTKARNNKIKSRLYRAAALGLSAGISTASIVALNGGFNSNEQHQRAVSDTPGQVYLNQGLQNGSIDPAMAVYRHEQ